MSNVKKYISLFIAEDARHADRLIYVLNECNQKVPSILYKISEAYINSGKDVDRMPSREYLRARKHAVTMATDRLFKMFLLFQFKRLMMD